MVRERWLGKLSLLCLILAAAAGGWWLGERNYPDRGRQFDGRAALSGAAYQMSLGPRIPGSQAHAKTVAWISDQLHASGWDVSLQNDTRMGHPIQNVVAKRGSGRPWVILGAHYDSRLWADQESSPQFSHQPVPGANDGASGVAALVELGKSLPVDLKKQVWLVFFDAEDNGDIPGWDWLLGSQSFVDQLSARPDAAVVIDMIGDSQLDIYKEQNSDPGITDQIWTTAAGLGLENTFLPSVKYSMLDDHTPFLNAGIRAVDIIDFDYPAWHTTRDTIDKISANSLQAVGETLQAWLLQP
jgi:Zn-dependent M28 family amino/carboxypeptidase